MRRDEIEAAIAKAVTGDATTGEIGEAARDPGPCCDAFTRGMKEIDSYITLEAVRNGREYKSGPFKYCPWCGSKL